jgi:hypothetical protein
MLCVGKDSLIGQQPFQHTNNMAAVDRGWNDHFMEHGRLHSILGSYSIPGINFSPTTVQKYRLGGGRGRRALLCVLKFASKFSLILEEW